MKVLFYLSLLLIFSCREIRIEYVSHNLPVQITNEIKFDTVGGYVTYIDTAISTKEWQGNKILWMEGFEVVTWDLSGSVHVAFLDKNKEPIKYKGLGLIK